LAIFWRFPNIFQRFPKIFQNVSKDQKNVSKHFPKSFLSFRKISEDNPTLLKTSEEDRKMFWSYTNKFKSGKGTKMLSKMTSSHVGYCFYNFVTTWYTTNLYIIILLDTFVSVWWSDFSIHIPIFVVFCFFVRSIQF